MSDPPVPAPQPGGGFMAGIARYAIGGLLARAVAVAVVPVYVRHLTVEEYGLHALALINEQVLVIVSAYAIVNAVGRFYADVRGTEGEAEVVRTALICVSVSAAAAAVLLSAAAPYVARLTLEASDRGTAAVRLISVSLAGNCLVNLASIVLLLQNRQWAYACCVSGTQLLAAAFSIITLVWWPGGLIGLLAGYAAASFGAGVVAAAWLALRFRAAASRTTARSMVRYGAPLVPAALLMLALSSTDRYVLRSVHGLEIVAVYSAAFLVASAAGLAFVTPFRLMWSSLMWRMRRHDDEATAHRRVFEAYIVVQVVLTGVVAVSAEPALYVVGGGVAWFTSAAALVPLLYIGFVAAGAADVLSAGYFFESKTSYHVRSVAAAAVTTLVLNLLLVPRFGVWAAALAYAAGFLVLAGTAYRYGRRFFEVDHQWWLLVRRALPAAMATATAVLALRAWPGMVGIAIALLALLVVGVPAIVAGRMLTSLGRAGLPGR
jgi:O-antigen/teichoic acid export membrane protein